LTRLPFVLGRCWAEFATGFRDGISQSKFACSLQEPSRVFDVLFFVQANNETPLLLTLELERKPWYDLE